MAAYMFSRPSNPSEAHTFLTSRQGRDETTTRHGKLVLSVGIFTDSNRQPITNDNQPLLLFGCRSFVAIGLLGDTRKFRRSVCRGDTAVLSVIGVVGRLGRWVSWGGGCHGGGSFRDM